MLINHTYCFCVLSVILGIIWLREGPVTYSTVARFECGLFCCGKVPINLDHLPRRYIQPKTILTIWNLFGIGEFSRLVSVLAFRQMFNHMVLSNIYSHKCPLPMGHYPLSSSGHESSKLIQYDFGEPLSFNNMFYHMVLSNIYQHKSNWLYDMISSGGVHEFSRWIRYDIGEPLSASLFCSTCSILYKLYGFCISCIRLMKCV